MGFQIPKLQLPMAKGLDSIRFAAAGKTNHVKHTPQPGPAQTPNTLMSPEHRGTDRGNRIYYHA